VQLLSELFVSTMDPTFIYDQARCFQQNRRYEDAIARFQEYLRTGKSVSLRPYSAVLGPVARSPGPGSVVSRAVPAWVARSTPARAPGPPAERSR
jgi:hypothetical protein